MSETQTTEHVVDKQVSANALMRTQVVIWKGVKRIDIRKFYPDPNKQDNWLPTKSGLQIPFAKKEFDAWIRDLRAFRASIK